jgi:hypothetical protein
MTALANTRSKFMDYLTQQCETALFGMDLSVLARSYGWAVSRHGYLFGLTGGDDHYEFTGIKFDRESLLQWNHEHAAPAAFSAGPTMVSSEAEALEVARKSEQQLRHELDIVRHILKDAGLTQQSDHIAQVLHSTPEIPAVAPKEAPPRETGPWRYGEDRIGGQQFIESGDFTHDVRLYINGAFAGDKQRKEYGEMLVARLNEAVKALPHPSHRLTEMQMPSGLPTLQSQLHKLVPLLRETLLAPPSEYRESDYKRVMRFAHDSIATHLGITPAPDVRGARVISRKKS